MTESIYWNYINVCKKCLKTVSEYEKSYSKGTCMGCLNQSSSTFMDVQRIYFKKVYKYWMFNRLLGGVYYKLHDEGMTDLMKKKGYKILK